MLIISFSEIFATTEFNDEFDIKHFDRVQAVTWIRESSVQEAQPFVSRVA